MLGLGKRLDTMTQILGAIHERIMESATMRAELDELRRAVAEHQVSWREQLAAADALVHKAEQRFRSARSAEERARRYAESVASDPDSDEGSDYDVSDFNGAAGNGSAVQPLHPGVANGQPPAEQPDAEQAARALKWNRR